MEELSDVNIDFYDTPQAYSIEVKKISGNLLIVLKISVYLKESDYADLSFICDLRGTFDVMLSDKSYGILENMIKRPLSHDKIKMGDRDFNVHHTPDHRPYNYIGLSVLLHFGFSLNNGQAFLHRFPSYLNRPWAPIIPSEMVCIRETRLRRLQEELDESRKEVVLLKELNKKYRQRYEHIALQSPDIDTRMNTILESTPDSDPVHPSSGMTDDDVGGNFHSNIIRVSKEACIPSAASTLQEGSYGLDGNSSTRTSPSGLCNYVTEDRRGKRSAWRPSSVHRWQVFSGEDFT